MNELVNDIITPEIYSLGRSALKGPNDIKNEVADSSPFLRIYKLVIFGENPRS
jgi:hypothetical protein